MVWLYVPGLEGSTSASGERPAAGLELWVTLSGTATRRPSSWRGWSRRTWIRRLYGTTSSPSTAARTAAAWITSQPATPASPSASRADARARATTATHGRRSLGSFARLDPGSSSWRTSQDTFAWGLEPSSPTFPVSGSMRNGRLYRRDPLERSTAGRGSSFSRGEVPTPSATSYGSSQNEGRVPHDRPTRGTPSLETAAKSGALPGHPRGSLNPEWVEQAMGFPIAWTDASLASETRFAQPRPSTPSASSRAARGAPFDETGDDA